MTVYIVGARLRGFGAFAGWHHGDRPHRPCRRAERAGVTRHVRQRPDRGLGHALQQDQRRSKFMRLAGNHQKIEQPSRRIADPHDFRAQSTPRTAQGLGLGRGVAIESQTQRAALPGLAPDAFWCARAIVPSMQANLSCGSPCATTWAMIRSQTPRSVQRRKRRYA